MRRLQGRCVHLLVFEIEFYVNECLGFVFSFIVAIFFLLNEMTRRIKKPKTAKNNTKNIRFGFSYNEYLRRFK